MEREPQGRGWGNLEKEEPSRQVEHKCLGSEISAWPYSRKGRSPEPMVRAKGEGSCGRASRRYRWNSTKRLCCYCKARQDEVGGAQGVREALSQILIRPNGNSDLYSPGQAEREELIQKPRGDRRDIAKKPQVSLHALHRVYKVYLFTCTCFRTF